MTRTNGAFGVVLLLLSVATPTGAAPVLFVTSQNSTIQFDLDANSGAGLFTWTVDGVDQLVRQGFWFSSANRVVDHEQIPPGNDEGGDFRVPQQQLTTASLTPSMPPEVVGNSLRLHYLAPSSGQVQLYVDVTYTLFGESPGSGESTLFQVVTLNPQITVPIGLAVTESSVNWIQYTNLNLRDRADDTVVSASPSVTHLRSGNRDATIRTTPAGTHFQVSDADALFFLLQSPSVTTLTDTATPEPGNLAHAIQFEEIDFFTPRTFVTVIHTTVPEPVEPLLLSLGLGTFVLRRRSVNRRGRSCR